jgi:hypothetical protein
MATTSTRNGSQDLFTIDSLRSITYSWSQVKCTLSLSHQGRGNKPQSPLPLRERTKVRGKHTGEDLAQGIMRTAPYCEHIIAGPPDCRATEASRPPPM